MYDVAAMPTAANAKATTSAAGRASSAHGELEQPETGQHREEAERVEAAADQGPADLAERDVDRAERRGEHRVVELAYLSLKNTLNVESNTAPFIADAARRPGAMNAA